MKTKKGSLEKTINEFKGEIMDLIDVAEDNPAAVIKAKSLKRSCSEMCEEVKKLDGVIQELEEKKRKMK